MKHLILTILAILVYFTANADVGDTFEYEGIFYTVLDEDAKTVETKQGIIIKNNPEPGNIVTGVLELPEKVYYENEEFTLTAVGKAGFANCQNLTEIILPESVVEIRTQAFYRCENLISASLPKNLQIIDNSSFTFCSSLANIELPSTLIKIGADAFACCGFKYIRIPDLITTISESAFSGSDLVGIELPNKLVTIEKKAFRDCFNLKSIAIPASVESIKEDAFGNCFTLREVHITDLEAWCKIKMSLDGPLVYGAYLFLNGEKIIDLKIPSTITNIGSNFNGCRGIKTVEIPQSVTTLGEYAFNSCKDLNEVNIANSVVSIKSSAFRECPRLEKIVIPNSVETIGSNAFLDSDNLETIIIGNGLKTLHQESLDHFHFTKDFYITTPEAPEVESSYENLLFMENFYALPSMLANMVRSGWFLSWETKTHNLTVAEKITVDKELITGYPGETTHLTATTLPAEATLDNVFWLSDEMEIAEVDTKGVVTLKDKRGTCKIIAESIYPNVAPVYITVKNWGDGYPEEDAVETVWQDSETFANHIYTLSGICVKRNASKEDIESLSPGLYIINGKKIVK